MSQSLVVSGLVAKRADLAEEVEHHRKALQDLGEELGHLEATIRLFDPNCDLGSVRPRKGGQRTQWFAPGECQRRVLEALREAAEPLSGRALAEMLVAGKALERSREVLVPVHKSAMTVLRRLRGKDVVHRSQRPDGTWVWELSGR